MRVYVPATLPLLADLVAAGSLPSPLSAYAVTDLLRTWADQSGPSDDDELELVALTEAARGSLRLLAADRSAAPRRVVLAVDVPGDLDGGAVRVDEGSDTGTPGQVLVTVDVQLARLRAVHVDESAAEGAVRAAVAVIMTADAGGRDSAPEETVVARADEHDLLWYAPEEIAAEPWRGT